MELTHVDDTGKAQMVDIGDKPVMQRQAAARGAVYMHRSTLQQIRDNQVKKGDVLATARIAAISGAKKTADLIPLCHNIPIDRIDIAFEILEDRVEILAKAKCHAKTGIEMEALTAVAVAALTIYDMCKAIDKQMRISDIFLQEKTKIAPTI